MTPEDFNPFSGCIVDFLMTQYKRKQLIKELKRREEEDKEETPWEEFMEGRGITYHIPPEEQQEVEANLQKLEDSFYREMILQKCLDILAELRRTRENQTKDEETNQENKIS